MLAFINKELEMCFQNADKFLFNKYEFTFLDLI